MTIVDALLVAFGLIAAAAGLLTVTTTRVVAAGLWLAVCLTAVGACFLILGAEFTAWTQILIYVGAVVVLLLFVSMLLPAPNNPQATDRRRWPAVIGAVAAFGAMAALLGYGFRGQRVTLKPDEGSSAEIGAAIFTDWVLGFEVLSALLLAALVGALALSRRGSQ